MWTEFWWHIVYGPWCASLLTSLWCFFQVKKDEVGLYLHKAHPGSWAAQLSSGTGGIETAPHS